MIPEEFKAIRRRLGLSTTEMGIRLGGYSRSAVEKWEGGFRGIDKAVVVLMGIYDTANELAGTAGAEPQLRR